MFSELLKHMEAEEMRLW